MLLLIGIPVSEPVHSRTDRDASCSGLSRYTSESYATEKGFSRRCDLLADIERDGELPPDALRTRILDELSKHYMIQIDFSGEVGLPRRAIDYLLRNMPEAAALVSAYSGKDYRATQTDPARGRDRFFVTNNETFAASFTYLFTRSHPDASEHMFFESGFAKVLLWRVWGNSFVHYHLRRNGESASRYDIAVHVLTDSRLLRTVLNSGPFRYFARSMFDGILEDIETTVQAFAADSNPGETLPPYFVMGLQQTLETTPREQRNPHQYREAQ